MTTRQIFIIGSPRSGTSALAWALAQHPSLWTSAESDFLLYLFRDNRIREAWTKSVDRPDVGWLRKHDVSYAEFARSIGIGVDALFRSRSKGLTWIDQTPGYTLMANILRDIFPDARFIHIARNGKDVVKSMLNSKFQDLGFNMKWTTDFEEACKTWAVYAGKAHQFVEMNPESAFEVRNEDLRTDAITTLNGLFDFLEIDSSDAPAQFLVTKRLNSSFDTGGKTAVDSSQSPERALVLGDWIDWPSGKKNTFNRLAGKTNELLGYN
jgi:hypothetical protein